MAAGTFERDAVPLAADAAVGDAVRLVAVDHQHLADTILVLALVQQKLDPAEIPLAFLADVADEQHVVLGAELPRVEGADKASSSASPRVSSPTPGAESRVPSRLTFTSVPSGNTVSRCADTTSRPGEPPPRRGEAP